MEKFVVCLTTVKKGKEGDRIARHLVKKRLVACVNVITGVISRYHWKKKLCRDPEVILLMKTTAGKVKALEKEIRDVHPYELPEFIVLPVAAGSRAYLDWVVESTR